jgi:hypothetical protein
MQHNEYFFPFLKMQWLCNDFIIVGSLRALLRSTDWHRTREGDRVGGHRHPGLWQLLFLIRNGLSLCVMSLARSWLFREAVLKGFEFAFLNSCFLEVVSPGRRDFLQLSDNSTSLFRR